MENNNTGSILICGSQNFNDREFVFKTLDTYYYQTQGNISTVHTSRFSGVCEYAREWVEMTNDFLMMKKMPEKIIKHCDSTFDMELAKKNLSLYEKMEIPEFILQNDPFFVKGKEQIIEFGINLVMCFPNSEGILGPSTHNISRFAKLAGVHYFDCSELLSLIRANRVENEVQQTLDAQPEESYGFKNHNPAKKM